MPQKDAERVARRKGHGGHSARRGTERLLSHSGLAPDRVEQEKYVARPEAERAAAMPAASDEEGRADNVDESSGEYAAPKSRGQMAGAAAGRVAVAIKVEPARLPAPTGLLALCSASEGL